MLILMAIQTWARTSLTSLISDALLALDRIRTKLLLQVPGPVSFRLVQPLFRYYQLAALVWRERSPLGLLWKRRERLSTPYPEDSHLRQRPVPARRERHLPSSRRCSQASAAAAAHPG